MQLNGRFARIVRNRRFGLTDQAARDKRGAPRTAAEWLPRVPAACSVSKRFRRLMKQTKAPGAKPKGKTAPEKSSSKPAPVKPAVAAKGTVSASVKSVTGKTSAPTKAVAPAKAPAAAKPQKQIKPASQPAKAPPLAKVAAKPAAPPAKAAVKGMPVKAAVIAVPQKAASEKPQIRAASQKADSKLIQRAQTKKSGPVVLPPATRRRIASRS